MKNCTFFFFSLFFVGLFNAANAQNISNEGSDFWLTFATHDPSGTNLAEMNINVTSKENTEVTVSCGAYTETKTIPANTVVTFLVTRAESYIDYASRNQVLPNKGIHVVVTPGKPNVSVYSHVYASARSAASLILPIGALGQKYYSMNYWQDISVQNRIPARNFLIIVATESNTKVIIHTKTGSAIPVTLANAGDVYEYIPDGTEDLTGTFVEADQTTDSKCKKFAAFSGSTSMTIACGSSRDPLFQQLYPISSWGKNYGIVPFYNRNYIIRILAQEDNTKVNVEGNIMTLNKGEFYESPTSIAPMLVSADKLISVAQYSLTQNCSSISGGNIIGDPEMVLLNPIEFNINKITLFSAAKNAIQNKYLNIFMRTDKTNTFKINGAVPDNGTWTPMPSDPAYSYIQIEVGIGIDTEESLTLTAADGFNAIAYGFGNAESYAYSAGTNLASSQFLVLLNKVTNKEVTAVCVGQEVEFKLTLPYLLTSITWSFDDGDTYAYNSPAYTEKVVNGQTLYTYKLDATKTFLTLAPVKLKVFGDLFAGAQSCNLTKFDFTFTVQVVPLPTAKVDAPTAACLGEVVTFKDVSTANFADKIITRWTWDFDDPSSGALNTSDQPNPTHIFNTSGKYTIKLMVASEDGCLSDVKTFDIFVNYKPQAKFNLERTKTCMATDIQFTDISTVTTDNIIKWTWDFGDPADGNLNKSNLQNPKHFYPRTGKYKVTLTVETDKGCLHTSAPVEVEITGAIASDFNAPDICVDDPITEFENISVNSEGTTTGLTYEWNFGDPQATASQNKSIERNGKHAYSKEGIYKVTLTIKNENGCIDIKSHDFTVNGANPQADFEVINKESLCSNTTFTVKNKSHIDTFGSITKIVWYVNGVEHIDNDPIPGKDYPFTLPQSTSDTPVQLIMFAYSGGVCVSAPHEENFVLHASPLVKFDQLEDICINVGNRQLIASQISTLLGKGVFSGKGVTEDGIFNPRIAGIGIHPITYTFTTTQGCLASATQNITVNPIPQVNTGGDFYILAGGQKLINASASGVGLTYKWTPAAGLNKDDVLQPIASPEKDTRYTLTVTSNKGCVQTEEVYVHVLQNINEPNSFTPNGDGVNDVWNIKYLDTYPNATVEIFDRNGQKVYYSKGYAVPFDGNYRNQALPVGTYYYIISPNSGREKVTGDLTIIR